VARGWCSEWNGFTALEWKNVKAGYYRIELYNRERDNAKRGKRVESDLSLEAWSLGGTTLTKQGW